MQKSVRKWEIHPPPCKIITPENIILKLCIRDYVGERTHHANFGIKRCIGDSPQIGEILPLCDFFCLTVLTFFLDPAPRSNCWTDLYALWLKQRVSAQGCSVCGLERWFPYFWEEEICPQNSPKMGGNRQFQAKTPKIEIAVSPKL